MRNVTVPILCLIILLISSVCQAQAFRMDIQDYYNPYVLVSFRYRFTSAEPVGKDHCIDMKLDIMKRPKLKPIYEQTFKINQGVSSFEFYLFIIDRNDSVNVEVHFPKDSNLHSASFSISQQNRISGMVEAMKNLDLPSDSPVSFLKVSRIPKMILAKNGVLTSCFMNQKSSEPVKNYYTPELDFFITASVQRAPETPPVKVSAAKAENRPACPEDELSLIKARDEAEKLYRMGKGTIENLNEHQARLNQYYISLRNKKKAGK